MTENREERLQIMLSQDELKVLDDFRFQARMPSRAAAVRELLKRGLAGEGFTAAMLGVKSSDFGITSQSPNQLLQIEEPDGRGLDGKGGRKK